QHSQSSREIDPEISALVDRAFAEGEVSRPDVQGGITRPRIAEARVPIRQRRMLEIEDVPLQSGESRRTAVARIRQIIGRTIAEIPVLRSAWDRAREHTLRFQTLTSTNHEELYNQTRSRFYQEVRNDSAAQRIFTDAGFAFPTGDRTAPIL